MANKKMDKRKRTQMQQKAAAGHGLHPRGLARGIAKASGYLHPKMWRRFVEHLPRTGQKYLHPELHRKAGQA